MNRGDDRAARHPARAIVLGASLLAAVAGCQQPVVGPTAAAQTAGEPEFEITGASVAAASNQLLVSFTATAGGVPMTRDEIVALRPTFTVAALSPHPVDGIPAWRNLLLTSTTTVPSLPPGGPGTPPGAILVNQKTPSSESTGAISGEAGSFTYLFANALPASYVATETLRVGAWLGAAEGSPRTSSTYDFVPAGGTPTSRDLVLDANCNRCHGFVLAHGRRVGVKLCATCHTWQQVDTDTVDPAALDGATAATDPNPLELGRFLHRVHRGKELPTLYVQSAGSGAISTPPPYAAAPPLPFLPGRNGGEVGRKFQIVSRGIEYVFGRIVTRQDNFQAPRTVAEGVTFPKELRECGACHAGAPQAYETLYAISRRTCSGCHPDVWYDAAPAPLTDPYHFAHTGGPQADDPRGPRFGPCWGCHVAPTGSPPSTVWVRASDAHQAIRNSPYYDEPVVEIVSVSNMKPGQSPTIVFKLRDRVLKADGTPAWLSTPSAPVPVYEKDAAAPGPTPSPIPRGFPGGTYPGLRIILTGPTAPDYGTTQIQSSDVNASKALVNPDLGATVGDPATGEISYTFNATLPADASGTWVVAFEGRRRATVPFYDVGTRTFRWPYTGEQVTESPDNALAYVDTAAGAWMPAAPGAAVPRRKVVDEARCLACHGRFELHGGQRHQVEHCIDCHAPAKTDWAQRPKVSGAGVTPNVSLSKTYDGIEERSIHFKVLVHRIHTGGARGAATLEGIEPHVVYGYGGTPYFFDEAIFPNDLARCTLCHLGTSYRVDAVPEDAPTTVANETARILHAGTATHVAGEETRPIQAACLGCHASSATKDHAVRKTEGGVETCAQCHVTGSLGVDVAHGLAKANASLASASWSSLLQNVIVPRCASAACHGGSPPANFPRLDAEGAYDAIVNVDSRQVSGVKLVKPSDPAASYLLLRMRGEGASVGGIGAPMPIGDAMLDASELAAFEAWILNGAPND